MSRFFKKKFSLLFFLFFSLSSLHAAVFIFDLGGVLLRVSNVASLWNIGITPFLSFHNPFNMQQLTFDFLHLLQEKNRNMPISMYRTYEIPPVMCDWLCGFKTAEEMQLLINNGLKDHRSFFNSKHQRKGVRAIASFMFNPERLAQVTCTVKGGIKLLQHLYRKKNSDGTRAHRIYILSNWDRESFGMVQHNFPELFQYVDGIVISGNIGLMKPDPAIFQYTFDAFSIDPDNQVTVFIDDQQENIAAANALHKKTLYAIHCDHIRSVKAEIKRMNLW